MQVSSKARINRLLRPSGPGRNNEPRQALVLHPQPPCQVAAKLPAPTKAAKDALLWANAFAGDPLCASSMGGVVLTSAPAAWQKIAQVHIQRAFNCQGVPQEPDCRHVKYHFMGSEGKLQLACIMELCTSQCMIQILVFGGKSSGRCLDHTLRNCAKLTMPL